METLSRNLRCAIRTLSRTPGVTVLAASTLAFGLATATIVFTLLESIVLRPLSYPEADRLVSIAHPVPGLNTSWRWGLSSAGYFFFRRNNRTLDDIGVYATQPMTMLADGRAGRVQVALVTPSLFTTLRAGRAFGRLFGSEDVRVNAPPTVAVLSHEFWRRYFGADPAVVGRVARIGGMPLQIVGVTASGVGLPDQPVDVWLPMPLDPAAPAVNQHNLTAIARLNDGSTLVAAQADLERLTRELPDAFPNVYSARFMNDSRFGVQVELLRSDVVGNAGRVLWILLAAGIIVLVVACANVANLFLVRTEARGHEIAVRRALGASRLQLANYFLVESLVVALLAGIAGILLAYGGLELLLAIGPVGVPRVAEIGFGWRGVSFIVVMALGAGVAFGLLPVLRPQHSISPLHGYRRRHTASHSHQAVQNALVLGQVALALVLLTMSGLMIRTFYNLRAVDPGFEPAGVLTMELSLPIAKYRTHAQVSAFFRELLTQLEGLPGVQSAAATQTLPLVGDVGCSSVFLEEAPPREGEEPPCVATAQVTPGYFNAMGMSVRGLAPDWHDGDNGDGAVVVTPALAERLWPGDDPIGKGLRPNNWNQPFYRVVGVTSDVRAAGLDKPPVEKVYFPIRPVSNAPLWEPPTSMVLVVRVRTQRPQDLSNSVRRVLAGIDPDVPIANVRTMEQILAKSLSRVSFLTVLLAIAAAGTLLLGTAGLYGVLAYAVGQRANEIGIRMALGARADQLTASVLRQSLSLVLRGLLMGAIGVFAVSHVLRAFLYGVSPADPWVLSGVAAILLAVALVAAFMPARRAARTDPAIALREG